MDLAERLDGYAVTTVPSGAASCLHLVWSAPAGQPDGGAGLDGDGGDGPDVATPLMLLAGYRITRVPGRVAS